MSNDDFNIRLVKGKDDLYELSRFMRILPEECRQATAFAINRTLTSIRAEGVRIATSRYMAKASDFRENARIYKASAKKFDISGAVEFRGTEGVPLENFVPSPKQAPNWKGVNPKKRTPKMGVKVRIKKGGSLKPRTGPLGEKSFWFPWKYKETGMHKAWRIGYRPRGTKSIRITDANVKTKSGITMRQRIALNPNRADTSEVKPLYGPSPIQALMNKEAQLKLQTKADEMFGKRLIHEIDRLITKNYRS